MINHAVSFNTPIIHVAVAVADTDETYGAYGAYAAAEDDTFNNTRNNDHHANHRNDDDDVN